MKTATFIVWFLFQWICLAEEPSPRKFYGAKLEPVTQVLHGAGQGKVADVQAYREALKNYNPVIFMDYCAANKAPGKYAENLKRKLAELNKFTAVQLGLSLGSDGKPELHYEHDVAAGKHDENLTSLFGQLKELCVPFYIRIGFECNGPHNGYLPEPYKKAFVRVTQLLRKSGLNAATVWCTYPNRLEQAMPYYPGDEWVDWWAVDLFAPKDIAECRPLLAEADKHNKPVMIGESTPRGVGVLDGEASWQKWYRPYFALIHETPGIKAFCYINWNWADYPRWSKWGDARLQKNEVVAKRYREEMASPLYLHRTTEEAFYSAMTRAGNAAIPRTP